MKSLLMLLVATLVLASCKSTVFQPPSDTPAAALPQSLGGNPRLR